jgi:hypothetical protein
MSPEDNYLIGNFNADEFSSISNAGGSDEITKWTDLSKSKLDLEKNTPLVTYPATLKVNKQNSKSIILDGNVNFKTA